MLARLSHVLASLAGLMALAVAIVCAMYGAAVLAFALDVFIRGR
jgi:hypothetical protein